MLTWAELTAAHSSEVSIKIIQKTMASADPKLCLTTRRYEMIEKYFTVDILQCWELVNANFLNMLAPWRHLLPGREYLSFQREV